MLLLKIQMWSPTTRPWGGWVLLSGLNGLLNGAALWIHVTLWGVEGWSSKWLIVCCIPLGSSLPSFWHQGLVLWKTVFHWPRSGVWFRDGSGTSCILCPLLLLYQFHLRSSEIRLWRLGTPGTSLRCMTSEPQVPNLNDHQSHLWSINIAVSGALRDILGWIPGSCTFEQPLHWVLMVTVGACWSNNTHYRKGPLVTESKCRKILMWWSDSWL